MCPTPPDWRRFSTIVKTWPIDGVKLAVTFSGTPFRLTVPVLTVTWS